MRTLLAALALALLLAWPAEARLRPAGKLRATGEPPADPFAGAPQIGGCAVFPRDSAWNTDISGAPVLDDYTDTFPAAMRLWPDFGGAGAYGIPYISVPSNQPPVPISFDVADESDPGPFRCGSRVSASFEART